MVQINNTNSKRGFTIIEVVLVLAIAGLIFLMVFIALPALQRSQRDTQRRNDYSMLSTAVTSYITNNGGRIEKLTKTNDPNTSLDTKKWINAEGTDPNGFEYKLYACSYNKWHSSSSVCGQSANVDTTSGGPKPSTDPTSNGSEVFIITFANCNGTDSDGNSAPDADAGIRSYVIYGHLEGSGTYCQDNNKTV